MIFRLICLIPMLHLMTGVESVFVAGFEESVTIYMQSLSFNGPMFPYLADNGQMVFYACFTYMFRTFVLVEFLLFAIDMMSGMINGGYGVRDTLSYLFKGGLSSPVPVMYVLSLVLFMIIVPVLQLGKGCYSDNAFLTVVGCVILSFSVFMISLTGIAGPISKNVSVGGILKSIREKLHKDN